MSTRKDSPNGGMGCTSLFAVLLTVLFIGLKLTSHIDWAWVWVLAPLWILLTVWVVLLLIAGAVALFISRD